MIRSNLLLTDQVNCSYCQVLLLYRRLISLLTCFTMAGNEECKPLSSSEA